MLRCVKSVAISSLTQGLLKDPIKTLQLPCSESDATFYRVPCGQPSKKGLIAKKGRRSEYDSIYDSVIGFERQEFHSDD